MSTHVHILLVSRMSWRLLSKSFTQVNMVNVSKFSEQSRFRMLFPLKLQLGLLCLQSFLRASTHSPPGARFWIMYPVISQPPQSVGELQLRVTEQRVILSTVKPAHGPAGTTHKQQVILFTVKPAHGPAGTTHKQNHNLKKELICALRTRVSHFILWCTSIDPTLYTQSQFKIT